jgi:outer membrane protein
MLKKIALIALFVLPISAMAQTLKFGHFKTADIITAMPEYKAATAQLQKTQKQYEDEMKRTSDELNKKLQTFNESKDSLPQNIADRRQKELQDMYQRGQEYEQTAQTEMTKLQKQLMEPITKKLEDAINAVGAAGGYTYIFDLSSVNVPYVGPASTDVTNMVKAKLGIK